jgi:hypothetical protein
MNFNFINNNKINVSNIDSNDNLSKIINNSDKYSKKITMSKPTTIFNFDLTNDTNIKKFNKYVNQLNNLTNDINHNDIVINIKVKYMNNSINESIQSLKTFYYNVNIELIH